MNMHLDLPSPAKRRAPVREAMLAAITSGHDCASCSGPCCTFRHNTMQITPLEALDIVRHLRATERHTRTMREHIETFVHRFDLSATPGDGRRALRKSYTCPFHTPGPQGCSIHPDHKPPGCLAFNPERAGLTEGGACASDLCALEKRQALFGEAEAQANTALQRPWQKAPIPVAVLEMWEEN